MATAAAETARVEAPAAAAGQAVRRYPLPAESRREEVTEVFCGMVAPVVAVETAVPAFQQTLTVVWAVPVAEEANPVQHDPAAVHEEAAVQTEYWAILKF